MDRSGKVSAHIAQYGSLHRAHIGHDRPGLQVSGHLRSHRPARSHRHAQDDEVGLFHRLCHGGMNAIGKADRQGSLARRGRFSMACNMLGKLAALAGMGQR